MTNTPTGSLVLNLDLLSATTVDAGVKIANCTAQPVLLGDMEGDDEVDFADYQAFTPVFGLNNPVADFNNSGLEEIFDFNFLIGNFGQ